MCSSGLASGRMNTFKAPLHPSSVIQCSPFDLLKGLKVGKARGRGALAYVLQGRWGVTPVAIKVMVSGTLDRTVLNELLVGPHLRHPNVVCTYFTRCARLTDDFMAYTKVCPGAGNLSASSAGYLLGNGGKRQATAAAMADDPMPLGRFHQLLHKMGATTGQFVTLVVMELCNKMTLEAANSRGFFQANQRWSEVVAKRALLRTLQEVARGMMHLHGAGVVHGDLKPANVLLQSSSKDRRGFDAKVSDFGLAHRPGEGARDSVAANSYGTVAYMAPEGFLGRMGFASDVYSFGVVLWEMLHREGPHAGLGEGDVVRGMLAGSLTLEWRPCPLVPGLVELGKRCLARDSMQRPTLAQVEAELVHIEACLRKEHASEVQQLQEADLALELAPPIPQPAAPGLAARSCKQLFAAAVAAAAVVAAAQPPAVEA